GGNRLRIGGHEGFADVGRFRPLQHAHDHRLAADIGQRLAGQAGRGHAGRNQNEGIGHRSPRRSRPGKTNVDRIAALIRVARPEASRYLSAAASKALIPRFDGVRPAPSFSRPGSPFAMNSFELNKVLGAILGTCLIMLALNIGANAIFSPEKPAKPGYEIAVKEKSGGTVAPEEKDPPVENLLASASIDKGKQIAKQCEACHTLGKGEPNKIGPNLWGIV